MIAAAATLSLAACSGDSVTGFSQMVYNATYTGQGTLLRSTEQPVGLSPNQSLSMTMVLAQLGHYLAGIVHGDFGISYVQKESVSSIIAGRLPATAKLGRAVALAHQSGNEDTARLLAKVVDVVDAETGTVRLKNKVEDVDEMALDTRSTKTVRVKKEHA